MKILGFRLIKVLLRNNKIYSPILTIMISLKIYFSNILKIEILNKMFYRCKNKIKMAYSMHIRIN
jgi:hypothetical protein